MGLGVGCPKDPTLNYCWPFDYISEWALAQPHVGKLCKGGCNRHRSWLLNEYLWGMTLGALCYPSLLLDRDRASVSSILGSTVWHKCIQLLASPFCKAASALFLHPVTLLIHGHAPGQHSFTHIIKCSPLYIYYFTVVGIKHSKLQSNCSFCCCCTTL